MPAQTITDDDLYRQSSQYRKWSFTKENLSKLRDEVNKRGEKIIRESTEDNNIIPLTSREEFLLVQYYSSQAKELSKLFRLPAHVKATAISYLKRFYVQNSVMEYHPRNILKTCLFLATKSENYFIPIEKYAEIIPKTKPQTILDLEYVVLLSLDFTLNVHHPFEALYGFYLDFQTILGDSITKIQLGVIYDEALKVLNESLYSDASLLYTPPQIALAALLLVDPKITKLYIEKKFFSSKNIYQNPNFASQFHKVLEDIQNTIQNYEKPSFNEAREIDKKLYYCTKTLNASSKPPSSEVSSDSKSSGKRVINENSSENSNPTTICSEDISEPKYAAKRQKTENVST